MIIRSCESLTLFYNDAYISFLGPSKHPVMLGRSAREAWPVIWETIGPMIEHVLETGASTWRENTKMFFDRSLSKEEVYVTYSYSPLVDERDLVAGIFCACTETTSIMVGNRRIETLRKLGVDAAVARTVEEACHAAAAVLGENPEDFPSAVVYLADGEGGARLVGSRLLDFSRIEAGRIQASYEHTDISTLTADLASIFRSSIESAGLLLDVRCEPIEADVYVDREMWEKIVLNLVSNAFKFTFDGSIRVEVAPGSEGRVELVVADTGTGVSAAEVPHLFERFHRVRGARSRTHEGTGIGLALVQELVKLHGGTVRVETEEDRGSTFTVSIPTGSAHLPAESISATRTLASTAASTRAFADEVELTGPRGRVCPSTSRTTRRPARVCLARSKRPSTVPCRRRSPT